MEEIPENENSSIIAGDNNIVVQGNINGANIVTGSSNSIALEIDDREYFLRRVMEELSSEGEDLRSISSKTQYALIGLSRRLAMRLRISVERVLDALEEVASMFS